MQTRIGAHFCNLKAVRISRNLTQQQLASKIDCKPATIAMVENNKRGCSLEFVIDLMDALDCGFRDLYPAGKKVEHPAVQLENGAEQLVL